MRRGRPASAANTGATRLARSSHTNTAVSSRHEHSLRSLRQWIRLTKTERVAAQDCGERREQPRSCWDLGSWSPYSSIFQRTTTKRRSVMCQRTAPGSNSERIGRMHSAPESQRLMMTSLPDQRKRSSGRCFWLSWSHGGFGRRLPPTQDAPITGYRYRGGRHKFTEPGACTDQ